MKNEYLISLYIDNELDLDEKLTFIHSIQSDPDFTNEALALLHQEKRLVALPEHQVAPVWRMGEVADRPLQRAWSRWWKPGAGLVVAGVLASLLLLLPDPPSRKSSEPHRFVLYLPEAKQAKIIGTFTGWQPVAMNPIGATGYWTLTLEVPEGEHRYSYLIGQDQQIADPTVTLREQDDFGGENSVLEVRRTAI